MKSLNPAIREKKRYLLIQGNNLKENVEKAILDFIGVLGMSQTGLRFIRKNMNSAIISINREMVEKVRSSLVMWPEKIEVLKVSGTLKGLKK